jgi:hypothetical protein
MDNSSVAKARSFARGIIDKNEKTKMRVSLSFNAKLRAQETGMQNNKRFNQEANNIDFMLCRKVGGGPTAFGG